MKSTLTERIASAARFIFVVGSLVALSSFVRLVRAQDIVGPAPQEMAAPGTFVISQGRITAVGTTATAPAGAQEIDARGLNVYPGLIDAETNLGLAEIESGAPGTIDVAEVGDYNPNAQAWVAVNPHSSHVEVTRVAGVTTVLSMPRGGIVSGQAAVINLSGTTQRELAMVQTAALVIDFPRVGGFQFGPPQPISPDAISTRDRRVDELRRLLRDAEAYGKAQDAYARDPKNIPRPETDLILAALVPYVRGERPVMFHADRERDIRAAVNFAQEMKLKPVIFGGSDAWKVASLLKERNVPVVVDSIWGLPLREDDPYDTLYENPAKLAAAGVRFAISTGDSGAHVRDLPFQTGMAVSFGLAHDEALKSITLYPAQILGVADRLGSIEVGKIANLVVTDGDILDARTNVRHLFIGGRQIPLVSRHTVLNDAFKDRK
jgi:imidazolonepropionase-like amidohydrolase